MNEKENFNFFDQINENGIVLSVPGKRLAERSLNKHNIYSCDANKNFRHRNVQYITARSQSGAMIGMYEIEKVLVLNPSLTEHRQKFITDNPYLNDQEKFRLKEYIKNETINKLNHSLRFYLTQPKIYLGFGEGCSFFPHLEGRNNVHKCYLDHSKLISEMKNVPILDKKHYSSFDFFPDFEETNDVAS